ncbi:MAG: hypothetical protein AVO33_04495 [delta proteobacterium ML8_F1]|nr:MAG: hypothetical protein AVO33_04495 [delta proteobacterium ML8_F1]
MSAFLGPIHHWLYHKILWYEGLVGEMLAMREIDGALRDSLVGEMEVRYGGPAAGELSGAITHDNIHGWLQERIHSVESRMAFLVTELLKRGAIPFQSLENLCREYAHRTAEALEVPAGTPEELFKIIYDHLIEGMPCDAINQPVMAQEGIFGWKENRCLHEDYWNQVAGDVNHYYRLRKALIEGFVLASGGKMVFELQSDGTKVIREVV